MLVAFGARVGPEQAARLERWLDEREVAWRRDGAGIAADRLQPLLDGQQVDWWELAPGAPFRDAAVEAARATLEQVLGTPVWPAEPGEPAAVELHLGRRRLYVGAVAADAG